MAELPEKLGCLFLGAYLQDNIDDMRDFIQDYQEWPPNSVDAQALGNVLASRFEDMDDMARRANLDCGLTPEFSQRLQGVADAFYQGSYDVAIVKLGEIERLLQTSANKVTTQPSRGPVKVGAI